MFNCPPTKPTLLLSLSLMKTCSRNYPSASPQKIPSSSLVFQNKNIFHRVMWAFSVSFSWSEFHRNTRTFLTLSPSFFLYYFYYYFASSFSLFSILSLTISISISLFLCHLSYLFFLSLEFCFSFLLSSPHDEEDESCCRFHQSFF